MAEPFIKPSHRGLFTRRAKASGRSVQAQASHDLHSSSATTTQKREANFARMAKRGWKPLNSHVKGNDEHHGHLDPNKGGSPLHRSLRMTDHHRGGFRAKGQEVPGGHVSKQYGGPPVSTELSPDQKLASFAIGRGRGR